MAKRLTAVLCLLILLVCSFTGYAAGIHEVNIRQIYLYKDVLHAYVELNSADGQPIDSPDASSIYASLDNDKLNVKKVYPFSEAQEGMAYIFMIDISGSLSSSQFAQLKNATNHWAERMNEKDKMAIITFGNEVTTIQDFTNDKASISNAINNITNTDNNTKLYGAIEEAVKLSSRNDADLPKRKAILLLTDGVNDFSGGTDEATALKTVQEALIPVYSIWTPGQNYSVGESFLNTLSDSTNGTVYNLANQSIDSIYTSAFEQFRKAYIIDLSYPAGKADGNIHNIKFTVRHEEKEASDDTNCLLKKPTENLATIPVNSESSATPVDEGGNGMSPIIIIAMVVAMLFILAIAALIIALLYKKTNKPQQNYYSPQMPQYSAEKANIPQQNMSAVPETPTQPEIKSGAGISFTLYEIGGHDVKEGRVCTRFVIGRRTDCDLVIQDPKISGQHCALTYNQGYISVEDLGSTNGTIINGSAITGPTKISSGDLILLGNKEYRINF